MSDEREEVAMRALFAGDKAAPENDLAFVRTVMKAVERDRAAARYRFNLVVLAASIVGIVLYAPYLGGLMHELTLSLAHAAPSGHFLAGLGTSNVLVLLASACGAAAFFYAEKA